MNAFAVRHVDNAILKKSQSGGAFSVICEAFFSVDAKRHYIWGVELQNGTTPMFSCVESLEDIGKFRGSKYLQVALNNTFFVIEKQLLQGSAVLFTGLPCQVLSLKKYLQIKNVNATNFYCVDIVCHGVPSPYIYSSYTKYLEKKYRRKITNFEFRTKSRLGWQSHEERISFKDRDIFRHDYADLFYTNFSLRPSCYECRFANMDRPGDLSIADCWGNKIIPDNEGLSLLLINSNKGERLFQNFDVHHFCKKIDVSNYMQPNLQHPTNPPTGRNIFWETYYECGFKKILKEYGKQSFRQKARFFINSKAKIFAKIDYVFH